MKTKEEHRQGLISLSDETLETLIDMKFVWQDSVTRATRDEFYVLQEVAEDVLAERRGKPLLPRGATWSVWSRPKPTM